MTSWLAVRSLVKSGNLPLIDVRAPVEFARGAIPGAINTPLLDDAERHELGLCYKTEGRAAAVECGLALFAAKADRYRDAILAVMGEKRRVAMYCWRGGMRSSFVARWLTAMGLEPCVLTGGYKGFRSQVSALLDELSEREFLVIDGRTGAGKTDFLRSFPADFPKLDFEGLARHRGSAFGDFAQALPPSTQQDFENLLVDDYLNHYTAPVLLVEIENVIGKVHLSAKLRERVATSPTVLVARDFADRVQRLAAEYANGWTDAQDQLFEERLQLLSPHMPHAERAQALAAVKRRDFPTAVSMLLRGRYDPVYDKGIERRQPQIAAQFDLTHDESAAQQFVTSYVRYQASGLKSSANQITNL